MKKNTIILIFLILLTTLMVVTCAKPEEKKIEQIYNNALNSTDENTKLAEIKNYLLEVVVYQSKKQAESPKKLNVKLLKQANKFANKSFDQYSALQNDFEFRVNMATVTNFLASYEFSVTGEITNAVTYSNEAIQTLDGLVQDFPDNALGYAYRAINFSYLPEFFGKKDIIMKDFNYLFDYVEVNNSFSIYEKELFDQVLQRAKAYAEEFALTTELPSFDVIDAWIEKVKTASEK